MKKIIILTILLLTGCGMKYELNIKKDYIEENIDFTLTKNGIKNDSIHDMNVKSDDFVDTMIETKISAFNQDIYNDDIYYEKKYEQDGNDYSFNLNYKFYNQKYASSRFATECFENHEVRFNDNKVYIHLSGEFYCYYDGTVDIIIKSDYKFKSANGKKNGNSYSWTIDESNYQNVDIELETTDESATRYYIYIIFVVICGIGVLIFLINFIGRILGRNNVNEV